MRENVTPTTLLPLHRMEGWQKGRCTPAALGSTGRYWSKACCRPPPPKAAAHHSTPPLFCTVLGAGEYIILGNLGKFGSSMSTSDEKQTGSGETPLYIYTMASKLVCSPVPPRCTNKASCVHLWFVLVWAIDLFSLSCC